MKSFKRAFAVAAAAALSLGTLTACGSTDDEASTSAAASVDGSKGEVYFLNFKPESDEIYQKVAAAYTAETGRKITVKTAASGTYEQTLRAQIDTDDAPTIFNINGPVGLASWQDYAADLTDFGLTQDLTDETLALKGEDDKVYGVPLAVEGYGIIYNDAIMQKYFALDGAKATSMDEIKGFAKLKEVADDMQARKDEIGIKGVFANTSLKSGEDWRWQTHLMDQAVLQELNDANATTTDALEFKYNDKFKNIFDLYITNSTTDRKLLTSKDVNSSMAEFALGEAAMVQNGNWGWGQVSGTEGNVVKESDIHFLPIYQGFDGEEKQGLNIGTENFLAVNSEASAEDQQASKDFLTWLFQSDAGKKWVTEELSFIAPYKSFGDATPADPLAQELSKYMSNPDLNTVNWVFQSFPSQEFKNTFGGLLGQYAAEQISWDDVVNGVKESWASESA